MADEEGMELEGGWDGDWDIDQTQQPRWALNLPPEGAEILPPPRDIIPTAYSKWPLERFAQAAHDGDLELLEKMLDREDPVNGFHHDINAHFGEFNALHLAAMNGQLESVEMLLAARADPHVRKSMPYGRNPKEGETARELADKWGWDEVVEVLKQAEGQAPKGLYRKYGPGNNAKLWPIDRPEGLDPEQEKRAKAKHKGLARPLPSRPDRKFYGELVFGITHGWDLNGKVIRKPGDSLQAGVQVDSQPSPEESEEVLEPIAPVEEPRSTIALLFPGQGSQYVKMMDSVRDSPKVSAMLVTAQRVLGYDLLDVCVNGPESKLEQTEICQPAIYVASLAAVEKLRIERPEAVERAGALAGLSLGEYTALTVAGFFSFEVGLTVVKARAEAMASAAKDPPQAMLSVAGIAKESLAKLCEEVRQQTGGVCQIANDLFPKGCTCAGTKQAIETLKELADKNGALQTKVLKTSGAFHTPFMQPARDTLEQALLAALPKLRAPKCDVYMNSTGTVCRAGTDPREVIPLLCDQLTSPVLWESCVRGIIGAGMTEFYEVGPMKQLKAMMKRIDQAAWGKTANVDV